MDDKQRSMSGRKWVVALALIMIGACTTAMLAMTIILYRSAVHEQGQLLRITAQGQARLIEAIARHHAREASAGINGPSHHSFDETLRQIIDAHGRHAGFLRTGEFMVARRDGDLIVFVTRNRLDPDERSAPAPIDSTWAEPMRRALQGRSGAMIGLDYRGKTVLAAHEPVAVMDLGIVAKVDLAEIRAPFVVSALSAGAAALAVVLVGTALFFRISTPIITRLEHHARNQEQEIEERKTAEESMRRFAHIVSLSRDQVALIGANYAYEAANDAYLQAHAMTRDEMIGRTVMDVFGQEFFDASIRSRAERCMAGEHIRHQDWFDLPGTGRVFMDSSLSPYLDAQGQVKGFAVAARDITELKRITDALSESEREFRIVTDGVPALIGYVDADRRYGFTNKGFETWLGLSRSASRGMYVWEAHGDDGYADLKPAIDLVLTGRRTKLEKFFPESRLGPIHLKGDLVPDLDADGNVLGCFVLLTIREEERLAQMQEAIRTLRDQLRDAGIEPEVDDPLRNVTRSWINPDHG
jgi:PAS domain S-box-containing protein